MPPTKQEIQTLARELSKRLSDEGRLIEAGWIALRAILPPGAPDVQVNEMRFAYMAGAQHLFSSIMGVLDPGAEPTAADLRRLELINRELEAFYEEMQLRFDPAKGKA